MVNMYSLILGITTFITGIFWCLEYFKPVFFKTRFWYNLSQQRQHAKKKTPDNNDIIVNISRKTGWIEICVSIFPVLLLVFIMRSFILEPFYIPSGSMMPTLLIGDFILVKKFAYGIKDPITQKTLIKTSHPKRGDIVLFKYPLDPKLDYIKRLVGLPGDRVIYNPISKHITVQPNCASKKTCNTALAITYDEFTPSDFIQNFNISDNGKINSSFLQLPLDPQVTSGIRLAQCKESFNGISHNILILPGKKDQLGMYYQQKNSSLAEWVVPKGNYFMIGDNRDNSADSRYWGFVPERNIVGKATTIWMSLNKKEGQWLTRIRLNRIGNIH
ncbi:Signal peptidase I [Candidatus Gullanella endobia]|uniref:Signal peptidase I n=1 Tax=Candidatus Gullanella endobia TaxID=1070130 RepID=A0A143WPP2_9ENTR|nr:signal peptidase I [Candidatus Gullanella endobia]CUX95692.1 Signal peptidase I [Candidatus Gullanella endobia]